MSLNIEIDWDEAPGVRAPELAATWAQLRIEVDGRPVTAVESESGTLRKSIHVPLYPLAEWIAFNWWLLLHDRRPLRLSERSLSMRARILRPGPETSWLLHHNFRGIGDGFTWPDLTIIPGESTHLLSWQGDSNPIPHSRIRYTTSGRAEVDSQSVGRALGELVETVVTRLAEQGETEHPLIDEWAWIQQIDAEEVEFCTSAARLGLDPADLSEEVTETILSIESSLGESLTDDFLESASAGSLASDLEWVMTARERTQASAVSTEALPRLDDDEVPVRQPWLTGQRDAENVRSQIGLKPSDAIDLRPFVSLLVGDEASRGIEGYGGRSSIGGSALTVGGPRTDAGLRFAAARAAWRFARGDDQFLLSSARGKLQKAERAFAAELTAPAAGIRELLAPRTSEDAYIALDEVGEISDHFGVNEWVVEYQIENQLGLDVADPGLQRL